MPYLFEIDNISLTLYGGPRLCDLRKFIENVKNKKSCTISFDEEYAIGSFEYDNIYDEFIIFVPGFGRENLIESKLTCRFKMNQNIIYNLESLMEQLYDYNYNTGDSDDSDDSR